MMPTSREWLVLLTIIAVTSLIPSLLTGMLAVGGIVGILIHRAITRALLRRQEQAALDRAVMRAENEKTVISLSARRRRRPE